MFILNGNYSIKYYCDCESIIMHHNFYTFRGYEIKICTCASKPTPQPPKQCHELEGKICEFDEECGKDGDCMVKSAG